MEESQRLNALASNAVGEAGLAVGAALLLRTTLDSQHDIASTSLMLCCGTIVLVIPAGTGLESSAAVPPPPAQLSHLRSPPRCASLMSRLSRVCSIYSKG